MQLSSLKAKFHYAIQLASWSQTSREPVCDRLELSGHVEIALTCLRQVCDLDSVMEFGHNSAVSCGIPPVSCGFQTVSDYQYHPRSNWPPSERCEIVVENNGE